MGLIFNVRNFYYLSWWTLGGQKYSFFGGRGNFKNTIRIGILMRYENFFSPVKVAGGNEIIEFTITGRYGLYYFFSNENAVYSDLFAAPAVDMRRMYSRILANRRFLKISLRTFFFRSKKLTKLLQKFSHVTRRVNTIVTLRNLLMFVLKIFTVYDSAWFIRSGLVSINGTVAFNDERCVRRGDIFN